MEKQKLNVLYILTKLELGGAQKVCLTLFNGIKEYDNNAFLITGNEGILKDTINENCNIILLPSFKREVSIKYFFIELKNFINLIKQIKILKKKHTNLIVHTHSTKAGIVGRWAALFAGVGNRIHTIHGFALHKYQNKMIWLTIYLLELLTSFITTKFICVSTKDIELGKKLFPNFKNKVELIRAGVDFEKFINKIRPAFNTKNKIIFGTVSCFKKQKNLIDLLKSFNHLNKINKNCYLEIIGDGVLRNELEKFIVENNLKEKIILHGWQSNVENLMNNWDIFVMSSLWEGLPCAIIEARLLKLPVLAYNTGGISDVIIHGKNGFLYDQGDWQKLALGMFDLSKNKILYDSLKDYNEDLNDFNNINMVKNHYQLYKRL